MQLGIDACALVLENFHLTHSGIGGTNRKIKTKRNNTWSQAGKSMCIFKQKKIKYFMNQTRFLNINKQNENISVEKNTK